MDTKYNTPLTIKDLQNIVRGNSSKDEIGIYLSNISPEDFQNDLISLDRDKIDIINIQEKTIEALRECNEAAIRAIELQKITIGILKDTQK